MRVWIDILTPKQVQFSYHLSRRLKDADHDVFLTTRRYREVNELLSRKKMKALEVGAHGGGTLEGKLTASALRVEKLVSVAKDYKPNVAVSFCSPDAARVSFGLGIPHLCICDSPHAEAVCRLTIPLSTRIITPKVIPVNAWLKYGIVRKNIVRYNAIDPVIWIRELKPDLTVLSELGITLKKPIIVFRVEESFASYLLNKVRREAFTIIPVLKGLADRLGNSVHFVVLPRYKEQLPAFQELKIELAIPKVAIDGPSLLFNASMFIGAGGTMTAEAALLGIPTISCYPGDATFIERYLIAKKLVVRATRAEEAVRHALAILENLDDVKRLQKERAEKLITKMEDPLEVIVRTIERTF